MISKSIELFVGLEPRQRRALLPAFFRLLRVQSRLKFAAADWLRCKLSRQHQVVNGLTEAGHAQADSQIELANALHESVRLAARCQPGQPVCLAKSIVLVDMLHRQNVAAHLCIGVASQDQQFASHAWVEVEGQKIGEPESVSEQFVAMPIEDC